MSTAWLGELLPFIWPAIPALIPLILCVIVEYVSPRDRFTLLDRLPGAFYVVASPVLASFILPGLYATWASLGVEPLIDLTWLPAPAAVVLVIVLTDVLYYWEHRFEHRFAWPIHAVHHAHVELHAANDYSHPLEMIIRNVFVMVPLSLIGLGSVTIPVIALMWINFWAFVTHAPTRLHIGSLRRVFVDERFHRIHHAVAPEYRDRNFAAIFTIWDQLFGTAYFPRDEEHPVVGVEGLPPPRAPLTYLLMPLRVLKSSSNSDRPSPSSAELPVA